MLGLTSLSLFALLLTPSALGDSHIRQRRRQHERTAVEVEKLEARGQSEEHALAKRAFTGRGTFYYAGLGACGIWNTDSDYIVALNSAQYHLHGTGYPGPECFKTITIQSNGVTVGGVQITDECPTCGWGELDLSPSLFNRFNSANGGTLDLTWWFDGDSAPATTTQAQTSTTPAWSPDPVPSSTSTWSPSPTPTSTSTWTPPSSTSVWVAPSSSTTTTSSSASSSATSSSSSSASTSSASAFASASTSTNPFAIISNDNSTSTSISLSAAASASASASAGSNNDGSDQVSVASDVGNLVAINGLVASYGQLIVVGAGGQL